MTVECTLKKLKTFYQDAYDLEESCQIGGLFFPLCGRFQMERSRYLLTREHKLWEAVSNEYVFFHVCRNLDLNYGEQLDKFLRQIAEPLYVRKEQKYPPTNHMYSYLTMILITDREVGEDFRNFIQRYKYNKNYLLTFRGYLETRMVLIHSEKNLILTNRAGKDLSQAFEKLLKERG